MGITSFDYRTGIGNVGSYLISGNPFITGGTLIGHNANNGEIVVHFPRVCKSFTIINKSNSGSIPIRLHFDTCANSDVITYNHFIQLNNLDDSYGFDVKSDRIYVSLTSSVGTGSFSMLAELTGVDAREMYVLTGSGINSKG